MGSVSCRKAPFDKYFVQSYFKMTIQIVSNVLYYRNVNLEMFLLAS